MRRFRVVFGLHLSTCGFCPVEKVLDGRAVFGEAFRVGQLFQDGFAFRLVAGEESGKLSLRQHGHASELFEAEPHGLHDDTGHLVVARQPVGIPLFHFPFGRAVFELFTGTLHPQGEPGMVNDAVVAFKFHFAVRRVAFRDAEPGVLFDAGHPQRFAFRVDIVVFRDVRHAVQPRGFLVQSHGDAVQDDGLSRSGVAADEEEGGCFAAHGIAQPVSEVDVSLLDGRDVSDMQFSYFHDGVACRVSSFWPFCRMCCLLPPCVSFPPLSRQKLRALRPSQVQGTVPRSFR